jgi:hypothetical protein
MLFHKRQIIFVSVLLIGIYSQSPAEISYKSKPILGDPWQAESLYVGSGLFARDSLRDIIVSWKDVSIGPALAIVNFIVSAYADSVKYLFHNFPNRFPSDDTIMNLGKYPTGTQMVFMYQVIDTNSYYNYVRNQKLFSGQNRDSVDPYVSEISTKNSQKRWALAGKIPSTDIAVMGFTDDYTISYRSIVFQVSNVYLEGIEKEKLSPPRCAPPSGSFETNLQISIAIPSEGSKMIVKRFPIYDTLDPIKNGEILDIFYTTDGSDPRISQTKLKYSNPIAITTSTTIKAYALLENDTNWFPSEVVTQVYTKGPMSIKNQPNSLSFSQIISTGTDFKIYSVSGKQLNISSAFNKNMLFQNNIPRGVYLVKSNTRNGVSSVKKVFVY